VTNNEQSAAHRILQKHGIEHTLHGHRLPLTSSEFAIGIADRWFHDFDDVRKYVRRVANDHRDAEIDLRSWQAAVEIAEAVRSDADADKP
jgi:6-pyruvoyl-tetrahydropterin synthase